MLACSYPHVSRRDFIKRKRKKKVYFTQEEFRLKIIGWTHLLRFISWKESELTFGAARMCVALRVILVSRAEVLLDESYMDMLSTPMLGNNETQWSEEYEHTSSTTTPLSLTRSLHSSSSSPPHSSDLPAKVCGTAARRLFAVWACMYYFLATPRSRRRNGGVRRRPLLCGRIIALRKKK